MLYPIRAYCPPDLKAADIFYTTLSALPRVTIVDMSTLGYVKIRVAVLDRCRVIGTRLRYFYSKVATTLPSAFFESLFGRLQVCDVRRPIGARRGVTLYFLRMSSDLGVGCSTFFFRSDSGGVQTLCS